MSSGRRRSRKPSLRRRWSIQANEWGTLRILCGTSRGKGFFSGMAWPPWRETCVADDPRRRAFVRPNRACTFAPTRTIRVVSNAPISSLVGIGRTRRTSRADRRGRTTSEGDSINRSTRQLLCALGSGSRTIAAFPPSTKELFIRGGNIVRRCSLRELRSVRIAKRAGATRACLEDAEENEKRRAWKAKGHNSLASPTARCRRVSWRRRS